MTSSPIATLLVALVAVVAMVQIVHGAVPTCSGCNGSVIVSWGNSATCEGGPSNATVMANNTLLSGPPNVCASYGSSSDLYYKWRCTASAVIADQYFSPSCSGNPYTSLQITTGVCFSNGGALSSAAYYCSAADAGTATAVIQNSGNGTVTATATAPTSSYALCSGSCPTGHLNTYGYLSSSCGGSALQKSYSPSSQTRTCFNSGYGYSTQSFCTKNTFFTNQYYGDCDSTPIVSTVFQLNKCFSLGVAGVSGKYTCSPAASIVAPTALIFALLALLALA